MIYLSSRRLDRLISADSHTHTLYYRCLFLDRAQEYLSPLFSSWHIKPTSHPSCLRTRSLSHTLTQLLKLFKPTIHLDDCTCWILHWYAVCPGDRFTSVLIWALLMQPNGNCLPGSACGGLLSHVPSWLVLLLDNLAVSYDRSRELCESSVGCYCLFFPQEKCRLVSGGLQTRLFHDENHCHT